ncbi:MAG: zf-HC2 domain-containing protein [Cellulosilyticum sp.]|nr:zf-HC2 domain-containing protein [Cellulosilyticum sp.]
MKCSEYEVLISAYVDGMLSPQEKEQVVSHLENCTQCKASYEVLLHMVDGCRQIKEIELPKDFHQNLMGKIQKEQTKKRCIKWLPTKKDDRWRYISAMVATFFLGIILFNEIKHINLKTDTEMTQENGVIVASLKENEEPGDSIHNIEERSTMSIRSRNVGEAPISQIQEDEVVNGDLEKTLGVLGSCKIVCKIKVQEKADFERQLEYILGKEQINYEKAENGYKVNCNTPIEKLVEWLEEYSLDIEWESGHDSEVDDAQIEIILMGVS